MREIKFRFWDGKEMIHVDGFGGFDTNGYLGDGIYADSVPAMQYTGLKDKNGVEIYEGDVLCFWDDDPSGTGLIVRFGMWGEGTDHPPGESGAGGYGWFMVHYDEQTTQWWADGLETGTYLLVIGNIYENPELIEAEVA